MYRQSSIQASISKVQIVAAKQAIISGHAAGLRRTAYDSALNRTYGDELCFGVSRITQPNSTLDAIEKRRKYLIRPLLCTRQLKALSLRTTCEAAWIWSLVGSTQRHVNRELCIVYIASFASFR